MVGLLPLWVLRFLRRHRGWGFRRRQGGQPKSVPVAERARRSEVNEMAECEVCGNDYDLAFEVRAQGATHVFDSFECAIHRMAPVCEHCGCRVIGHGVQVAGRFYCCAHCAATKEPEGSGIVDNVGAR
jgi:Rieske Fe-S protein